MADTKEKCSCQRKKDRAENEKNALINRLKRIEGQIRGITAMVEGNAYCPDILVQVSAASSALSAFSRQLLTSHINTCVKRDISENKEGAAEELAALIEKLLR